LRRTARTELLVKSWFLPIAFLLGLGFHCTHPAVRWYEVLVLVVVFEFLFYQARYLINDLRDIDEDVATWQDAAVSHRSPRSTVRPLSGGR
jgi:4-hydroxybenzoate polyprenyltransferase